MRSRGDESGESVKEEIVDLLFKWSRFLALQILKSPDFFVLTLEWDGNPEWRNCASVQCFIEKEREPKIIINDAIKFIFFKNCNQHFASFKP